MELSFVFTCSLFWSSLNWFACLNLATRQVYTGQAELVWCFRQAIEFSQVRRHVEFNVDENEAVINKHWVAYNHTTIMYWKTIPVHSACLHTIEWTRNTHAQNIYVFVVHTAMTTVSFSKMLHFETRFQKFAFSGPKTQLNEHPKCIGFPFLVENSGEQIVFAIAF